MEEYLRMIDRTLELMAIHPYKVNEDCSNCNKYNGVWVHELKMLEREIQDLRSRVITEILFSDITKEEE